MLQALEDKLSQAVVDDTITKASTQQERVEKNVIVLRRLTDQEEGFCGRLPG